MQSFWPIIVDTWTIYSSVLTVIYLRTFTRKLRQRKMARKKYSVKLSGIRKIDVKNRKQIGLECSDRLKDGPTPSNTTNFLQRKNYKITLL